MSKVLYILIIFNLISFSIFSQKEITTSKSYFKSGQLKSEINFYKKGTAKIRSGKSSYWYKNGELKNTISYKNNKLNGERISYWRNGKPKRKDFFEKGKLKSGKCFDNNGNEVEYYDFEIQPEFPGGKLAFNNFIKKHLIFNTSNAKGKLVFKFTIGIDGKASNIKILKNTTPRLENEVFKMFDSMPNWKPAKQDGNLVEVKRTIPINLN